MGQSWPHGYFELAGIGHRNGLGGAQIVGAASFGGVRHLGHFVHAHHCWFVEHQHGPQLLWRHVVAEYFTGLGDGGQ